MGALLDHIAVPHDQDRIRVPDGGQAVGDDEGGAAFHHGGKGLLDPLFCADVDGGGRFVKDQHRGQAEHYAGDAQQLLLTLGEGTAVFRYEGVVAFRQPADKAVGMGRFGGGDDLVVRCFRAAEGDDLPDRTGRQPGILQDHADVPAEGFPADAARFSPVQADCSAVDIVKAHQQVDERGLPAAGRTDDRHAFPGLHVQVQVRDQRAGGIVGETYMLQ